MRPSMIESQLWIQELTKGEKGPGDILQSVQKEMIDRQTRSEKGDANSTTAQ